MVEGKNIFITGGAGFIANKIIKLYIEKNNIDMLVIMNKKHSFLERLFTTHTVEKFAFKIDIPLLVIQRSS